MNINLNNIKGLTTETTIALSACIDKMGIKEELVKLDINTGDTKKDNEELGKQLIALIITRIHRAKDEIYEMIANYKGITIDEAKKAEIIPIIKEILGIEGTKDFLS